MNTITKNHMSHYLNNPIKALHRLRKSGFTQEQAEAQIEIFSEVINNELATKNDLRKEISALESKMEQKFSELELKLTLRVTLIMGFFYALDKFF